jgi:hypothetical protein
VSRPSESTAGWHPVDPLSLVAGLLAVGVAVISLLDLDLDGGVVVAVLLVVAGGIGLAVSLRRPEEEQALEL